MEYLVTYQCEDCGREWRQYTHDDKLAICLSCHGENVHEKPRAETTCP